MTATEAHRRQRWAAGQACHGLWSLLPGAVTGDVLGRTGADLVVVDLQHGAGTEAELPGAHRCDHRSGHGTPRPATDDGSAATTPASSIARLRRPRVHR